MKNFIALLGRFFSIFFKIFLLPGKIFFPLAVLSNAGKKGTPGVLTGKAVLQISPLRKSGEFIFSVIAWIGIGCAFSTCTTSKEKTVSNPTKSQVQMKDAKAVLEKQAMTTPPIVNQQTVINTPPSVPAPSPKPTSSDMNTSTALPTAPNRTVEDRKIIETKSVTSLEPTFDCEKASNRVEVLICHHEELTTLDNELNSIYEADTNENKKNEQIAWIRQRNRCKDVGCIRRAYQNRIQELNSYF